MPDSESGKITLAVLSQQILTLTQEVAALRADVRTLSNGVTESRIIQSRHDTQIINLGEDYDSLSNRVNGWSALNSLGVVVAAVIGAIFGSRNP